MGRGNNKSGLPHEIVSLPGFADLLVAWRDLHDLLPKEASPEEVVEAARYCEVTGGERFSLEDLHDALLASNETDCVLRQLDEVGRESRCLQITSWLKERFPDVLLYPDGIQIKLSHMEETACPGLFSEELGDLDGYVAMLLEEGYRLDGDFMYESGLILEKPEKDDSPNATPATDPEDWLGQLGIKW